jgi:hypothetical protein
LYTCYNNVSSLYMYDVYKHVLELFIVHTCQHMNYIMPYSYVYLMYVYQLYLCENLLSAQMCFAYRMYTHWFFLK